MRKFIFICSIAFHSCNGLTDEKNIEVISLEKQDALSQLNDSTFLSDTRSIYYDKYLYLADNSEDQIYMLSKNGDYIETIGNKGNGPGEFLFIGQIFVKNDTLYAHNSAKRSIEVFKQGHYVQSIYLPSNLSINPEFRFFYSNTRFYLTSIVDKNTIISLNPFSDDVHSFSKVVDLPQDQKHIRNNKEVLFSNEKLISVSDNFPVIERFTLDGKLTDQLDLSNIEFLKDRLEFINARKNINNNSYSVLVSDAYVSNKSLYLLLIDNQKGKPFSNKILEVLLEEPSMKPHKIYNLGEGWFTSICVADKFLWAFNNTAGELVKYKLGR